MKRLIFLTLTFLFAFSNYPANVNLKVIMPPSKPVDKKLPRSVIENSLIVDYDPINSTVEVVCFSDLEGEVFIYSASGELENYSPTLNTILNITPSEYHTILIQGDGWSATGIIE